MLRLLWSSLKSTPLCSAFECTSIPFLLTYVNISSKLSFFPNLIIPVFLYWIVLMFSITSLKNLSIPPLDSLSKFLDSSIYLIITISSVGLKSNIGDNIFFIVLHTIFRTGFPTFLAMHFTPIDDIEGLRLLQRNRQDLYFIF